MIQPFNAEKTGLKPRADHILISCVFLLTGVGIVTLYSASYAFAERFIGEGKGMYFVNWQLLYALAGVVVFFAASWINLDSLRKLVVPIVAITALLCLLTLVPGIGVKKNGAARWVKIGFSFQPSELVKLALPFYLAHIFSKKRERINSFVSGILPPTLITVLFFILIYLQNNFSTAIFIAANALFIFFLAGVQYRYFIAATVILTPLSAYLILSKEHRIRRVISYIMPDWEPQGAGYQVHNSLLSIGSGGLLGKGFGQGTMKIASVPEIQSDFIFSSFSEEAGLAGVILFYALFVVFTVQGYRAAMKAEDMFRRLLGCGMVTIISSQALLNIAVVSGAVPATGIPLPFFSAGGSSLLVTFVIAGIIVNVSRKREASYV